jgi:hypothetical protein
LSGTVNCISNKRNKYINTVISELNKLASFSKESYNYVIIIPQDGCVGCISEAESFLMENNDNSIFFIFTKVYSEKDIKLRIGESINKPNVYIDKKNVFVYDNFSENIYPLIFNIKDKNRIDYHFFSPGEDIQIE